MFLAHSRFSKEWLNRREDNERKWSSDHIDCLESTLPSCSFVGMVFFTSLLTYSSLMNKNYFQSRAHKHWRRKWALELTLSFWVWVFRETGAVGGPPIASHRGSEATGAHRLESNLSQGRRSPLKPLQGIKEPPLSCSGYSCSHFHPCSLWLHRLTTIASCRAHGTGGLFG